VGWVLGLGHCVSSLGRIRVGRSLADRAGIISPPAVTELILAKSWMAGAVENEMEPNLAREVLNRTCDWSSAVGIARRMKRSTRTRCRIVDCVRWRMDGDDHAHGFRDPCDLDLDSGAR
jgi:hypothetical protein